MRGALKTIILGFLLAVGSIIAYLVWSKLSKRKHHVPKRSSSKLDGRQPGFVDNLLDNISGFFGRGNKHQANPNIVGPYGAVGITVYGDDPYMAVASDSRIPDFLSRGQPNGIATGGVQDPAMPGKCPPQVLGPPPLGGSGAYYAPDYNWRTPCYGPTAAYDAKNSLPN